MPAQRFPTLNVVVGTRCDFSCRHCLFDSKTRSKDLKDREIASLQELIRKRAPRSLFFAGGEPFLYVATINKISSTHPCPQKLSVGVTTNGGFAETLSAAKEKLTSIDHLRHVRMSYDKFHSEFVPISNVKNMFAACEAMRLSFRVIVSIESPLDMGLISELRKIGGFGIEVQPVFNIGRARKNAVSFSYPAFDRRVLRKHCPNRKRMAYVCGKGFSICCSYLLFNGAKGIYAHKTAEEHMRSNFYRLMKTASFGKLLKIVGRTPETLLPEHSSECALCDYLFKRCGLAGAGATNA